MDADVRVALINRADEFVSRAEIDSLFEEDVATGLFSLFNMQSYISALDDGALPKRGEDNRAGLRTYGLAVIVEWAELLQELGWKPWKEIKDPDKVRIADEFADVLAFTGLMLHYMLALGVSIDDLAAAYVRKSRVNFNRLAGNVEGYQVHANKAT